MKFTGALLSLVNGLDMPVDGGRFIPIRIVDQETKAGFKGQRTYLEMEDLGVSMFNDDAVVQQYHGSFTKEAFTAMFMQYGCYCNTRVTGGGAVPGPEDPNDELCNTLYKCYKCINIDYDHEGAYAAEEMVYTAEYNSNEKTINCHDRGHLESEECPHNICQCDRLFLNSLLDVYKQCLLGDTSKCHSEQWYYSNGFDRMECFGAKKTVINDQCCGVYPDRVPYNATRHECCNNHKLRQPGSC